MEGREIRILAMAHGPVQSSPNQPTSTTWRLTVKRKRFFVLHLKESRRPEADLPFQIQILNHAGQGIAFGYADEKTTSLEINGERIPLAVIEAARRQKVGNGDYVDESGASIPPF